MTANDLAPPTSIKGVSRSIKEYLLKFVGEFEIVLKDFPGVQFVRPSRLDLPTEA